MKRKRPDFSPLVCTREEWEARIEHVPEQLPLEMWVNVTRFVDTFDMARMSYVCVAFYHALGSIVVIGQHAVKTRNEDVIRRMGSSCLPVEVLLHPLRWTLLTRQWGEYASTIQEDFARHYQGRSPIPHDVVLAGGYVRSLVLHMFRACGVMIPEALDDACHDLDFFFSRRTHWGRENVRRNVPVSERIIENLENLMETPFVQSLIQSDCFPEPDPDTWRPHFDIPENTWSDDKPIQCIIPSRRAERNIEERPFSDIISNFDFTCVQAAVIGAGSLVVTPGFLFSLLTGNMLYTRSLAQYLWPLEALDDSWHRLTEHLITKIESIWKCRILSRYCKYVKKGYKDPTLTEEDLETLEELTKHEDYISATEHGLLDYDELIGIEMSQPSELFQ